LATGTLKARNTQLPLANALVVVNDSATVQTNKDGYFSFSQLDTGVFKLRASKAGFLPLTRDLVLLKNQNVCEQLQLTPAYAGLLHHRVFVLDPESFGSDQEPVGQLGTRSADINLRVAQYLAQYLRSVGARVVLTREGASFISPVERVVLANQEKAHLYIIIEHSSHPDPTQNYTYTGHYYKSGNGSRLATLIAEELGKQSSVPLKAIQDDYRYTVMQTGCPAVVVNASLISHPAAEELLNLPARNRTEAYAIFNGILRYYGADSTFSREVAGQVLDSDQQPVSGALVTVDEYITVQTGRDGHYCVRLLEPGNHWLKVTVRNRITEHREIKLE
jgi:N-acetylmuramoyl-L-alanine amidase